MKKLEKLISEKLLTLKLLTSGLSIKVNGVPGPFTDGELPKAGEFGRKIVQQLKSQ